MKPLMTIVVLVLVAYGAYEILRVVYFARISSGLVRDAQAFERSAGLRSILVLGDSTAVGVGAQNAVYTIAGRLSSALDASVDNHAKSGAVTKDLAAQFSQAQKARYDAVLIQVGANDVIQLHDADAAQADLARTLAEVAKKSDRVVLLTAGKIGNAPLFPWFARSYLTDRAAELRERFKATAEAQGVVYVDLFAIPDPFGTDPKRYYAPDGLHLTDDGYGFWYEQVAGAIEARWPDLYE